MSVQYWGLPPEVNAIRLTTGPGAAAMTPVLAAYQVAGITHIEQGSQMLTSAVATATGSWQGVGGPAMLASATSKSQWQFQAGAHAEKAGALIGTAAAAHAAAVAATIPYPVVIGNRVREAALQASNIIGQNTPAIIESNVEYATYWAENATAMSTYASAAAAVAAGLSVPLAPPMVTGVNPASAIAGMASLGGQVALSGAQSAVQALGTPLQAAGQAVSAAAPAALSAATSAAPTKSGAAEQGDGFLGRAPLAQPGGSDLLSSGESMMGLASAAPQALQGMTQPLSQLTQLPQQVGSQLTGMMGAMPGMGGGPGAGGLAANAPGSNLASSMGGVNGGHGAGGGPVSAALTKSGGAGGPIGLPSSWLGAASAPDSSASSGQNKPVATNARAGSAATAAGGASMGPGMYGMPPAAAAGQRNGQNLTRGEDDTSLAVALRDADAIPILTADGVVYADEGG
ncbi:MAG: PPE family protein [Actinomycetia bacterium]|nr:PPE family protein [Actinomycetes bacterium]